jgi:hypothetical protein
MGRESEQGTRRGDREKGREGDTFPPSPIPPLSLSASITKRIDTLIALGIVLASLALYLRTLAPDVVDADGGEFQFAAWNFAFVHPTGYPLFLILGGLFQHLVPFGNPAFRLNLFNAIVAALAVAALYLVVHEITQHRGASIIAAASFAVTRMFWYDASAAETYALNAFFIALLMFIALRWQAAPSARIFATFCFVYGLALTHHRTVVLWIPAFVSFFVLAAWQSRNAYCVLRNAYCVKWNTQHAIRNTFYFLLPLLLYLYLPLRAPASPYAVLPLAPGREIVLYDNSLSGFANYVLGQTFQAELGWDAVSVARLTTFPQLLLDQFGAIGVALGALGFAAMLWRKDWARLALLLVAFATTALFAALYHIGDIAHYYIPAYLVWAIWISVGVAWLLQNGTRTTHHVLRIACSVLLGVFVLAQVTTNFPLADRSRETQQREQWTRILAAPIPQDAILISNDRDEMMPLWYIQFVENTRRDVLGLFPLITPAPQHANIARLTDGILDANRPVFFIKAMPGIEIKYRVATSGSLWRMLGRAADGPPQFASDAILADRMRVVGYDVARESGALRVALYWQARAKLARNYTTFVHLLDTRSNKIVQNDHQVGGEFYPTTLWDVGETLHDEHVIVLPSDLAAGRYRLVVGMYAQPEVEMLGEPVEVGAVEIGK